MKRTFLRPRSILAATPLTLALFAATSAEAATAPITDRDGFPLPGNLIRKGEQKPPPAPTPPPPPPPAPPAPKPKPPAR